MKTHLTTLHDRSSTCALAEPLPGMKPGLALLMRLFWAAALVLPAFGAQAGVVLTTLYSFEVFTNGANPTVLVQGSDGSFYGATTAGGANNLGTVFKIGTNGALTSLHSFAGTNDGAGPSGLVQGRDGNIYGTTSGGGTNNLGTVFQITPNGALTSLYSFTGTNDGWGPNGLTQGSNGYFYGTTTGGGTSWKGTVFKINANGALISLYSFTGGNDGASPSGLVQGSDGYFYGTTYGVIFQGAVYPLFPGTVFKISTDGAYTSLYSFGINDRFNPAALVQGRDGNFYGTTTGGGTSRNGTVFKLTTDGTLTSLYSFTGTNDGSHPVGLVEGSDGSFYGTTSGGGAGGAGTVFRLTIVPPPQLTLIPSSPYVILTWPADYAGFSYAGYALQSTTNLVSPVWSTVSPDPVVIGGENVVINTISGAQQFYRLTQ